MDERTHHAFMPLILVTQGEDDGSFRVRLDQLLGEDGSWIVCYSLNEEGKKVSECHQYA